MSCGTPFRCAMSCGTPFRCAGALAAMVDGAKHESSRILAESKIRDFFLAKRKPPVNLGISPHQKTGGHHV